jgi:gamma-glutamyltranspeptidase/glutathione hydrolase
LAKTFRAISEKGTAYLYGGDLGQQIATAVSSQGGFLTTADFREHHVIWVDPISVSYGKARLWEMPPNGQGVAALESLKILEPLPLAKMGHNSADYLHHVIEATKLAYADLERAIGDPEFMSVSADLLTSEGFVADRRRLINPAVAQSKPGPDPRVMTSDTTYLAAADKDGNMVSFINSICSAFGSGVVVPGTGFALQNRAVGFTLQPGRVNTVAPRRLPFHTIIPAFITETDASGRDVPSAAFGIMGGANQPQAHLQVFLNLVEFGFSAQEAIDAPRVRYTNELKVVLDPRIDPAVRADLVKRGHEERRVRYTLAELFGVGHIIRRIPHGYEAASDTRADGYPAGY